MNEELSLEHTILLDKKSEYGKLSKKDEKRLKTIKKMLGVDEEKKPKKKS
jgi:hypothetical protein